MKKIGYKYLQSKISKLNAIITTLMFPCYISIEEDKASGDETNVFQLFRRINSSGVNIESGETIQANLLEKNTQNDSNDLVGVIRNLEKNIYSEKNFLPRKKIWEIFAKIAFIDKNRDKFLSGEFDSINLDEYIENFVNKMTPDDLKLWIEN